MFKALKLGWCGTGSRIINKREYAVCMGVQVISSECERWSRELKLKRVCVTACRRKTAKWSLMDGFLLLA